MYKKVPFSMLLSFEYRWSFLLIVLICLTSSCIFTGIRNSNCATVNIIKGNYNLISNHCYVYVSYNDKFYKEIYPTLQWMEIALQTLLKSTHLTLREIQRIKSYLRDEFEGIKLEMDENWNLGRPYSKKRAVQINYILRKGLSLIRKLNDEKKNVSSPDFAVVLDPDIRLVIASKVLGRDGNAYLRPPFSDFENEKLLGVKSMDLSNSLEDKLKLHNLEGVELFPNLQTLKVNHHSINNIEALAYSPSISNLSLNNNKIISLKGIEHLRILTYLSLKNNSLKNLRGLENLIYLKEINLEGNPDLESIEPLFDLIKHSKILPTVTISCTNILSEPLRELRQILKHKLICK